MTPPLRHLRRAARIILVGPPGSGKGTQTHRLLTHYPMSSISSGDLLRSNVRARTPLGLEAEAIMKAGGLLSDSIMVNLIVGELASRGWVERKGNLTSGVGVGLGGRVDEGWAASTTATKSTNTPGSSWLLDGFPRTRAQAEALEREVDVNFVVNLEVPREVILKRVGERWVHEPSGRIYNTSYDPPKADGKDDVTGEVLTRRADDNPETFKRRLDRYEEVTTPLLEHYKERGLLWSVQGETSDEITPKLDAEILKRFG